MNKKKALSLIAATSLVVAFFTFFFSPSADRNAVVALQKEGDPFAFVRTMEGTVTDGDVSQTAGGELVINAQLRLLFEYYLAATGEKSLKEILAGIDANLGKKLSPKAKGEASNLLSRYIGYKQALVAAERKNPDAIGNAMAAVRRRFLDMQELRQQFFSHAESQAMFGADDAYDMDAIARLEISQNNLLSEAQKRERFTALDSAMSAELRAAKEAPYQVVRLEEHAQELRAHGASEDDIYRMRAAALTPEAAARLAQVDAEESQWKSRITAFLDEKNRLNNDLSGKTPGEKQAALQKIRDQNFNSDEQKRLPAYEQ